MTQNWQIFLVGQALVIIGGLIGIYISVKVKLAELEVRMKVNENRLKDVENMDSKMNDKLDHIIDKISTLKAELQNKVNR